MSTREKLWFCYGGMAACAGYLLHEGKYAVVCVAAGTLAAMFALIHARHHYLMHRRR